MGQIVNSYEWRLFSWLLVPIIGFIFIYMLKILMMKSLKRMYQKSNQVWIDTENKVRGLLDNQAMIMKESMKIEQKVDQMSHPMWLRMNRVERGRDFE